MRIDIVRIDHRTPSKIDLVTTRGYKLSLEMRTVKYAKEMQQAVTDALHWAELQEFKALNKVQVDVAV